MDRRPILYEKPQGVRDYLPNQAGLRRQLEQCIAETYQRWGYEEIITPTFEYLETFQNGLRGQEDRMYKMIERSGKTVVLRPDMTAPIARVVSSLLKDRALPLRLYYIASIFRQQEVSTGRDAEFTQAGVEHFGDGGPDADAEMIALAVAALESASVRGFRIAVGQVAYLNGFLEEHVQSEESRQAFLQALLGKDFVQYEACIADCLHDGSISEYSASALSWLQRARGGPEVFNQAREWVQRESTLAALENLQAIWQVLELHQVTDFIQLDLGLLHDLDYYTGCVFEGYAPGIGFPIVSGGRYDNMASKFGRSTPATGFMIGVERLLEVLDQASGMREETRDNLLLFDEASRMQALSFCRFIRSRHWSIACSFQNEVHKGQEQEGQRVVGQLAEGRLVTDVPALQTLWREWQSQAPLTQGQHTQQEVQR